MSDCCGELLAEGLAVSWSIGVLSIVEPNWLVGGNSWLLSGRLGNEMPKLSSVLCFLAGLHFAPPSLPIVFCDLVC